MSNILITGGAQGLGREIASALKNEGHTVAIYDKQIGDDVLKPDLVEFMQYFDGKLDVLINNAGVNRIDFLEDVSERDWDQVMGVNAKGIFLMSQACLPYLKDSKGTILNIVSNAAHMPMNSSIAYNASKGAAHIMTRQMARELYPRHGIHVLGVAPNKLKGTEMSNSIDQQVVRTRGWTMEEAQKYQLASMPINEETPPKLVAEFIAYLLQSKDRHKYLHGCILPYGA